MALVKRCPNCDHVNDPDADSCAACACNIRQAKPDWTPDDRQPATAVAEARSEPDLKPVGTRGPRAALRAVDKPTLRFTVTPGAVVGRGETVVDLTPAPESQYISQRHARFHLENGQWYVEHLGTNPTKIAGIALAGKGPVYSGQTVVLGMTAFVFDEISS